jgi:nitrogen fixation/metabolism regulation signal transduction histidine kinase
VATGLIGAAHGGTYLLTSLVSLLAAIGVATAFGSRKVKVHA